MDTTIKDIAKIAGVSYATVSRALNDKYGVNPATRETILRIAGELNYSPNAIARGLVKKETYTVGLIIPDITNPFFPEVARGAEDLLEKEGYSVFLCNSNWEKKREKRYIDLLIGKRVDGLIIAPAASSLTEEDRVDFKRLPVVLMNNVQSGTGIDSVVLNNVKGGYIAGQYLLGKGRRKFCFIGGSEDSFSVKERFSGFLKSVEGYDRNVLPPDMIKFGDYRERSGYRIMKDLIDEKKIPDAVFASNDLLALGAIQAVSDAGLSIPEDVAIIGFDNIATASFRGVELTTIEHPKYRMGEIAVKMLLKRIDNPEREEKEERLVLDPELIIRKTA